MAKSSRASSIKTNNRSLKKNVFGPVETARIERLSQKLVEIASQPKPQRPIPEEEMVDAQAEVAESMDIENRDAAAEAKANGVAMDVDTDKKSETNTKKSRTGRGKVEKNRKPRNSLVFKSFKDRQTRKKKRN